MPRQGGKRTKTNAGSRKKPFSGKQKKEQLAQKCDRRRQHEESDSNGWVEGAEPSGAAVHTSLGRSGQENALSTMFVKELTSVVDERKRAASMPICLLGVGNPPRALPSRDTSLPFPLPPGMARAAANGTSTQPHGTSFMHEYDDAAAQRVFAAWLKLTFAAFPSWSMNKFEVNLNVWKQLWHTLQHSTHLVFVVDARNPLFHVHFHLYDVCSRLLQKPLVLLLNKSELVPSDTLQRWIKYLQAALPQCSAIVPFTTAAAQITFDPKERLASRRRALREAKKAHDAVHKQARLACAEQLMHALQLPQAWPTVCSNITAASGAQRSHVATVAQRLTTTVAPSELTAMALPGGGLLEDAAAGSDSDEDWRTGRRGKKGKKGRRAKGGKGGSKKHVASVSDEMSDEDAQSQAASQAPSSEVGDYESPSEHEVYSGPPAVIGMIGYPNVGKSSVINLLLGGKRVSVSRTPGHTKHCQSLPLCGHPDEGGVVILDCPGLVFPCTLQPGARDVASDILQGMAAASGSAGAPAAAAAAGGAVDQFAHEPDPTPGDSTTPADMHVHSAPEPLLASGTLKLQGPALQVAMQECAGVVPLAQVREPYSAVRFLCEALPLPQLLGIKPEEDTVFSSAGTRAGAGGGSSGIAGVSLFDEEGSAHAAAAPLSRWSPYSLCEAYAEKKGIRIARTGAPDTHAAGRAILYDTVDGVLPLYWEPPQ